MHDAESFKRATNLAETYNAVNPDQSLPPNDPRYVDCAPWRGDENLVRKIARNIEWADQSEPVQHLKQLIAGHRGCGKSTELLRLKDRLEQAGYFVVYIDAALDIDMNNVDYSDILMTMLYHLVEQAQASPFKLKLSDDRLDDLALRLARVTIEKEDREEAEIALDSEFRVEAKLPFFLKVMAAVRGFIKSGSSHRKLLRIEIQQRTTQFLQDVNALIDQTQTQLRDRGKSGLVMIIDSLDRIIPHSLHDRESGNTHTALYLDHSDHLKAPHCHIVYTVPISLFFNENLSKVYPDRPLTLPMIKTNLIDGGECNEGLEALQHVISSRVAVDDVFENQASVGSLCRMSGGHIRDLLRLVRYACDYSDEKITAEAVHKAERALVREYERLVKDEYLQRLLRVHREKRLPSDGEFALLPYHLLVLEYQNEGSWADVHPAVAATRVFREALENEKSPTTSPDSRGAR